MSKTVFIPMSEDMQVLHPVRTMHEDLRDNIHKIEDFISRICQYVYVDGVMDNTHWKVKDYKLSSSEDGTVVLVHYRQNLSDSKFAVLAPQTEEKPLNTSPLPEPLHFSVM